MHLYYRTLEETVLFANMAKNLNGLTSINCIYFLGGKGNNLMGD